MNENRINRLGTALLVALAFIVPIAHTTGLRNTLAGLLTLLAVGWAIGQRRCPGPDKLLFAWLAIALLSVTWSIDPRQSAGEFLAGALLPLGCCWAAWEWLGDERRAGWMATALSAGLLAILLLRITVVAADFEAAAPIQQLYDTHWPGRGVASTISILAMSLAFFAFCRRAYSQAAAILLLALVVGAQNWNRMFWLAALAAALPPLALAGKSGRRNWAALLIVVLLVAAGLAYSSTIKFPELTWTQIMERTLLGDERLTMWRQWAGVVAARPVLGYGFGHKLVQQAGVGHLEDWVFDLAHAHNVLANVLVQLGALGLAVYLTVLGGIGFRFVRALNRPANRPAAIAGLSLIVGMLAKNMTDDFMQYASLILFWVLLGMYARLAGIGRKEAGG